MNNDETEIKTELASVESPESLEKTQADLEQSDPEPGTAKGWFSE